MASVPSKKSFSDVKHLSCYNDRLPAMAEVLTAVCAANDAVAPLPSPRHSSPRAATRLAKHRIFDVSRTAHINIKDYLVRMCKYGYCSPTVFVCMALYVDRFRKSAEVELTSRNIHRILLAAFLVAAKLNDDIYYSNKYYASIGGVSLPEINEIEAVFLECTNWDMHVNRDDFDKCMRDLKVPSLGRDAVLQHLISNGLSTFGANRIPEVREGLERRAKEDKRPPQKDKDPVEFASARTTAADEEYITAASTSCSPASSSSPSLKATLTLSNASLPAVASKKLSQPLVSQQSSGLSLPTSMSPSKRHLAVMADTATGPVASEPGAEGSSVCPSSKDDASQHAAGSVAYAVRAQKRRGEMSHLANSHGRGAGVIQAGSATTGQQQSQEQQQPQPQPTAAPAKRSSTNPALSSAAPTSAPRRPQLNGQATTKKPFTHHPDHSQADGQNASPCPP